LHCSWCDTRYTWDWERYDKNKETAHSSVIDVQTLLQQWGPQNVVITGGEPMLQQRALVPLVARLRPQGFRFEVETNATVPILPEFDWHISQYNCSPKLASSGNTPEERETEAVREYAASRKSWFKFVVTNPRDVREVHAFVARYGIAPRHVILMPEGTTREALFAKYQWVRVTAGHCGFRWSRRLHIELYGDERGR